MFDAPDHQPEGRCKTQKVNSVFCPDFQVGDYKNKTGYGTFTPFT